MILVTGGTGLVGIHLLMQLSKSANQSIVALYRSKSKVAQASELFLTYNTSAQWKQIQWVKADITDIPSLEHVYESNKITKVYHCAAYVAFERSAFQALKKTNIEGTANMINFSVSYNVEKFCYVSSIATLNLKSGQTIIDECSSWNSELDNSGYAISKFGGEMEVWRGSEEGLDVIIVHPGVIIGDVFRKGGSTAIFENLKKGMLFYTDGSSGYVTAFDVAKASIELMNSNIRNDNFILVSENLTNKEVTTTILNSYGKKPPQFKVPKLIVLTIAALENIFNRLFRYTPKVALDLVSSLFSKTIYSSEKIENKLDFKFAPVLPKIADVAEKFNN